jgi:hypothetical protein
MLFKELIKSIIPQDVKDKKVLYDSILILLDYIEENTNFSFDISKIFSTENAEIKNALVSAYLENLKTAYEKAVLDDNISERLQEAYAQIGMQYTPNIIENISEVLNNEYIYTAKEFKQKKGTVPAIEYAYNAIRGTGLQTIEVNTDLQDKVFSIKEGTDTENIPFIFRVEGSLYKEVYENTVKPIVHPVGFGYLYSKLSSLFFDEFVNVKVTYPNTIVKVVCTIGSSLDYSSFTVTNIIEEKDEFLHRKITVIFGNNNLKLVRNYDTTVILYDLEDNIITEYSDYCALYLEYTPTITTKITDDLSLTQLSIYDKEYIGYLPGTPELIGNFVIGNLNIGGLVYIGFIQEDFLETLECFEGYNTYYQYINEPSAIGTFTIGDKYTWKIGYRIESNIVNAEAYSTSVEVEEDFSIEII